MRENPYKATFFLKIIVKAKDLRRQSRMSTNAKDFCKPALIFGTKHRRSAIHEIPMQINQSP